jgi:hypothetical protein
LILSAPVAFNAITLSGCSLSTTNGVGSSIRLILSAMSDDEHSVSAVRGSDTASWNKDWLDIISVTFKVLADSLKGKGLSELVSSNAVTFVE